MELSQEVIELLEQLPQPIFLVKDGTVVYANCGARARDITDKINVEDIITTGYQEYQQFSSGKLVLTTTISGAKHSTIVTKFYEYHMFCLESSEKHSELNLYETAAIALRTPLSDMHISIDELMLEPSLLGSDKILPQIKNIKKSIYQIHRSMRNMADAAGMVCNAELRDIVSFLSELVEKANALLRESGQQIEFKALPQPVYCQIYTDMLERAVLNLILNAVKYGTPGKNIKLAMHSNIDKVYISVQNDFEKAQDILNSNIFSRYSQEPTIQDSVRGIGLGLTIVHNAAAAHKGTLLMEQIDSSLKFTISLSADLPEVCKVNSPVLHIDNNGGFDTYLIELSEILPIDVF